MSGMFFETRCTYNLHHNFGQAPTVEKFNPPANFSQFKHCSNTSAYYADTPRNALARIRGLV